ncbi:hypothetical protein IW139_005282, partial [Coemansia sp. RSA 353]
MDFVADPLPEAYKEIYKRRSTDNGELEDEDDADVYCWYTNLKNSSGGTVLHKMVSMKTDDM